MLGAAVWTRTPRRKSFAAATSSLAGLKALLASLGEKPGDETVQELFNAADADSSGGIDLDEFLAAADKFLGGTPARCVLIVGGPGTGKGLLVRHASSPTAWASARANLWLISAACCRLAV